MKLNKVITLSTIFLLLLSTRGISQSGSLKPSIYALVIGVSDYKDSDIPDLQFAEMDAKAFASFLKTPSAGALTTDNLVLLNGAAATRSAIIDNLEELLIKAGPEDLLIFYFSGHGKNGTLENTGFLLPYDAVDGKQESTCLNMQYISSLIEKSKAKVKLSYIDACHAGRFRIKPGAKGTAADNAEIQKAYYELLTNSISGSIVFMSSSDRQESAEMPDKKRGLFTFALLEGLSGKADRMNPAFEGYNDSVVTANELKLYITNEIHTISKGKQSPSIDVGSLDLFPLSVLNPKISIYKMMSAVKLSERGKTKKNDEESSADTKEVAVEIKLPNSQASSNGVCAGILTIYNQSRTPLTLQSLVQKTLKNRSIYNPNLQIGPKSKAQTPKLIVGDSKVLVDVKDCFESEVEYELTFRWEELGKIKSGRYTVSVKAGYNKPVIINAQTLNIKNEPQEGYAEKHPIPSTPEEIKIPINSKNMVQVDEINTISVTQIYPNNNRISTLVNGRINIFYPGSKEQLVDPAGRKYNLYFKGITDGFFIFSKVY